MDKIRCFRLMESISEDSKSIGLEGIKQGLGRRCRRNIGRIEDVIQALGFGSGTKTSMPDILLFALFERLEGRYIMFDPFLEFISKGQLGSSRAWLLGSCSRCSRDRCIRGRGRGSSSHGTAVYSQ